MNIANVCNECRVGYESPAGKMLRQAQELYSGVAAADGTLVQVTAVKGINDSQIAPGECYLIIRPEVLGNMLTQAAATRERQPQRFGFGQ